jgi:hypothetical protein
MLLQIVVDSSLDFGGVACTENDPSTVDQGKGPPP